MGEDSRDPGSAQEPGSHLPASTPSTDPKKPKHEFPQSQVGKLWDAFGNPEEPVNALAKASYKPPGKNPADVSYSEIVGNLSVSEMSSFYKKPCARDALMTGIGAGFGIGGVRGVFGGWSLKPESWKMIHWLTSLPRATFTMVRWKLGCWGLRDHFFGKLRVLSTTTNRGTARHDASCGANEGIEGQETTGQGACSQACGGGKAKEELVQPLQLQVLVASLFHEPESRCLCGICPKLYIPILCEDGWHHVKSSLCIIALKVHISKTKASKAPKNNKLPNTLVAYPQMPGWLDDEGNDSRHVLSFPCLNVKFDSLVDGALLYAANFVQVRSFISFLSSLLPCFPGFTGLPFGNLFLSFLGPCPRYRRRRLEPHSIDPIAVVTRVCWVVAGDFAIMPYKRIF